MEEILELKQNLQAIARFMFSEKFFEKDIM